MEEFEVGISQVTGGSPSRFLSAILWACFKSEHVLLREPLVVRPNVGDSAIISKDGDKRYQDSGIIVSMNMKRMSASVKFDDSDNIERFRFSNFQNFDNERYPFPSPPHYSTLPDGCKTLNQVIHLEDTLTLSQFAVALLHRRDESYEKLRVIGMLLMLPQHAVAAFPCPSLVGGWIYCNSWGLPCQNINQLSSEIVENSGANAAVVDSVCFLYQVEA